MPAAAHERAPGLVEQAGDLGRRDRDRQRAGVDAALVEQVADQAPHVVGLRVDDAEELDSSAPGSNAREAPSTVAVEPLIEVNGARGDLRMRQRTHV